MFLVCGEALYDLFLTASEGPGALTFEARAGGSPFNVAVGLARQGAAAALLTGISDDMLGRRLTQALEAEGVETRHLVRAGRRTTLSLVDLTETGAPAYAFYGLGSADCALTRQDLPAIGEEIAALHFGSYSIAVAPAADAFAALAETESRRFISLDPNARPTVLPDPEAWRGRIARLVPFVNVVKVSAEDLRWLYPGAARSEIASRWLRAGVEAVIVTDGGETVTAFRRDDQISVAPPSVEVVDAVGAGDAFQAALLSELSRISALETGVGALSADLLQRALSYASEVAALTCARRGADIPRRSSATSPRGSA